jgi:TPR repeat protein
VFKAFVLGTALALASVGTATAQDAGRSNLEAAQAANDRGDFAEAVRQFRMAADQGNAIGQNNLGLSYLLGEGVPQNDAEAVRWFRMAADQGDALAQSILGAMYADGRGVPQNYAEAYKWYALSAAQGNADAVTFRDAIIDKMTPAQIAEGQRLAAAWRPR